VKVIVNRIYAAIISGFIFSLALIGVTPSATASISQPQNEIRINISTVSVKEHERLP
jgi:hypothetical protein